MILGSRDLNGVQSYYHQRISKLTKGKRIASALRPHW